jgi:vancomycin resistance protein YoaR
MLRQFLRTYARRIIALMILVAAGVTVGLLVLPPPAAKPDAAAAPPPVMLVGEKLDVMANGVVDRAMDLVRKHAAGNITLKLPNGKSRELPRAALGAEIDKVYLAALVAQARDATSPMRRRNASLPKPEPLKLPSAIIVNTTRAMQTLLAIKDELDTSPSDARLDLATRKLVAEVEGNRVDVYATLAKLDDAFANGDSVVEAIVESVRPGVVSSELGAVDFDEVLGYYETRYNTDKKHEARTYNLRLAASKLDGHVLLPGQTFDFNRIVGARNEANGYKVATVIAQGELVDGIGGGTCQITGTLHASVFFAGLEVLNRTPHTRPSAYIQMGLDAAVAYPTINFRFKNTFPHPIVIHETVKDGIVRAEILGPHRTHTVTFVRKFDEIIPFQEVEKPDPKLPEGVKVLGQRGIPGFKLRRFRIVREGPFAIRERWNDTYPPTNQVIRVGTATDLPKDTPTPADDPHPEFTTPEYLVITQGPEIKGTRPNEPGGGTIDQRDKGRTGVSGWTEKAGMSHWDAGKREEDADDRDDDRDKKKDPKKDKKKGKDKDRDSDRDEDRDPPKKKKKD